MLLFLTSAFGQKTEIRISLNSGLFSFSGPSGVKKSYINYNPATKFGYTNNPYGSKNGLCYGLSGNLKKITKRNLVLGLDLGYETLRSKVTIDAVSGNVGSAIFLFPTSGKTFLNYNFINLYPQAGQRFQAGKVSFDIVGGFDLSYCLKTTEKGKATATDGTKYTTSVDRKTISTDVRPRIQFSIDCHNAGVYVGYSYTLNNYKSGYVGTTNECYGRLIRFGIMYRFK